jgi:sulfite reductase (NADPH) flavoprotein alpha-component
MAEFERWVLVIALLLSYGLLCVYCSWAHRRVLTALGVRNNSQSSSDNAAAKPSFLVAYASQSGTAAALAQRSAALLHGQMDYQILPLNKVDNEVLSYTRQALFVLSTYGEGEPPDNGMVFAGRYLKGQTTIDLSHLQFSVLALGDKIYQQFCAFGHSVHQGLSRLGAIPLGEPLEVCASAGYNSEALLQQWRQGLKLPQVQTKAQSQSLVQTMSPDSLPAEPQDFSEWRLVSRSHLNLGSPGAPVFLLSLGPVDGVMPKWQAGDLIEVAFDVYPDNLLITQVKRKYSIASIPQDGVVELIVRRHINDDGSLGIGSGWLTAKAPLDANISLRLCENPQFHAVEAQRPMILIGSGTGLAGLRAHIKQRALKGVTSNWLLFGERSPEHDGLCADEITVWQQVGALSRVDLAFSRDPHNPAYVQDLVLKYADELRLWLQNGAVVYVCGNRLGMAQGVDHALQQIIPAQNYQQLLSFGLYRRDVY